MEILKKSSQNRFSVIQLLKTGQDLLIFLLFTPPKSERELNTTFMCRLVPERLFCDFSIAYKRRRSCSLMTIEYPTLLVSLFYRYYNRLCSMQKSVLIPENSIFLCNSRLLQREHPYVVDWAVDRTIYYGQNSFFSRTIRVWNFLGAEVVIFGLLRNEK